MKKKFLFLCIPSMLIFTGCQKDRSAVACHWQSKHIEAKLYDVPLPLHAQLVQNMSNTECVEESNIISYEVSLNYEDVVRFYQEEMERLGWWQTATFKGSETLLNFEKPNKYCSISIRPLKKISRVIIFIGHKEL